MLLVHNYETEAREGKEYGGAGPKHDSRLVVCEETFPDIHAFIIGEFGMIYNKTVAECAPQSVGQLRGQRNFGHEI